MTTAKEEIGHQQTTKKKRWITDGILAMFEERRQFKNQNSRGQYTMLKYYKKENKSSEK